MSTIRVSKGLRALGIGAVSLVAVATAALAADLSKEAATAGSHAGMAASSADLKTLDSHLKMTINCLVGPKGKGFDAKVANPCKDLGNGAIADASGNAADQKILKQALSKAQAGLTQKDLAKAKADATATETLLKKVM
ncbi:MAG TPA: hypothetical protein VHA10_01680 [Hypericibacter adhaerens]|jgi:hypothetical protein|uniref:Uncharacterized protein n=1 Tax=Hypericibacter adhaerens TaxID=2602016 RepID=A0A5J6N6P0_9PROT|nr:hypothetical protein [Hypericibacter adhaerens]QEX22596.1 hypothetical protein FRZ61_25280 [Hypericibacter adhaerens]HWA41891.1 hypothetical protein [Hypericibacter adhaerens]